MWQKCSFCKGILFPVIPIGYIKCLQLRACPGDQSNGSGEMMDEDLASYNHMQGLINSTLLPSFPSLQRTIFSLAAPTVF